MIRYLVARTLLSVLLLLLVAVLTFVMIHLVPGDQAALWLGPRPTPEQLSEARQKLGLNKPIYEQFYIYLDKVVHGDLGISLRTKRAVADELRERFPATLELVSGSLLFAVSVGLLIGYLSAHKRGGLIDAISRVLSISGVSMPIFWLALVTQLLFSSELSLLPLQGRLGDEVLRHYPLARITGIYTIDSILQWNWTAFGDVISHLAGPVFCLTLSSTSLISRMFRSSMIEALEDRYVTALQAIGIGRRTVGSKFALRMAIIPTITIVGLTYGYLLGGSFVIESIFDWPGLGKFAVDSLLAKDIPSVLGVTLLYASSYIGINLVIDIVYGLVDPRIVRGQKRRIYYG